MYVASRSKRNIKNKRACGLPHLPPRPRHPEKQPVKKTNKDDRVRELIRAEIKRMPIPWWLHGLYMMMLFLVSFLSGAVSTVILFGINIHN